MKTIKIFMLLMVIALFMACSSDDTPNNQAPVMLNQTLSMDENPTSDLLTTIVATDADEDTLTFSIVSQTPANSVIINSANGQIYVGNASAFNYELNTSITVTIAVTDGINITQSVLIINILDVNENG